MKENKAREKENMKEIRKIENILVHGYCQRDFCLKVNVFWDVIARILITID